MAGTLKVTHRADDDLDPEIADNLRLVGTVEKTGAELLGKLFDRWGKRFLLAVAVLTAISVIAGALGWRREDHTAAISALSAKTDRTFIAVEAAHDTTRMRVDSLARSVGDITRALALVSYVQCIQLRRYDPDLLPPDCQQVIREARNGRGIPRTPDDPR
jgi:hypothetical protein